jgi:magnesium chelatase family protein
MMDGAKECRCRMEEIVRYRDRLSGPMLDRIDIHLEMPRLSYRELSDPAPAESSEAIRCRVEAAREIQRRRFTGRKGKAGGGIQCNAHMTGAQVKEACALGRPAALLLKDAVVTLGLSGRAYDRVLKVARTVADLAGSAEIRDEHVAEAIHYRSLDRTHMPQG